MIYDLVLGVLRELRPVVEGIERRDGDLARQMRRALTSVPLNTAEAIHARGRNAAMRFGTAMGSMRESRACVDAAVALGYVEDIDAGLRDRIDRVVATLYKLSR